VQLREINPYPYEVAPACERVVSEDPQNGRLNYLYGRTMLHMGELNKAYAALETAASQGYLVASLDLGQMLLDSTYPGRNCLARRKCRSPAVRDLAHADTPHGNFSKAIIRVGKIARCLRQTSNAAAGNFAPLRFI
jgi:Tetratricopeptide repeat